VQQGETTSVDTLFTKTGTELLALRPRSTNQEPRPVEENTLHIKPSPFPTPLSPPVSAGGGSFFLDSLPRQLPRYVYTRVVAVVVVASAWDSAHEPPRQSARRVGCDLYFKRSKALCTRQCLFNEKVAPISVRGYGWIVYLTLLLSESTPSA